MKNIGHNRSHSLLFLLYSFGCLCFLISSTSAQEDTQNTLVDEMLEATDDFEEIVFALRQPGTDHWYANFGYYSSPVREYPPTQTVTGGQVNLPAIFRSGGRLMKLNVRTKELTPLLIDTRGSIRDPKVHYDGQKILFSYRKALDKYFHLYEIGTDGSDLTQLTDSPYNDIEPTYLPGGGICFVSDRCNRWVNCWRTPVANLHVADSDGRNIRMISANIEHDNTPWVLPDGRILFMRWEYVDRNQVAFHHLWTVNPDGTGQAVYYGNMHPGVAMLDAKPIPGSRRIVASFSPSHGRPEHAGNVTIVDPRLGPDAKSSARVITKGSDYRDPFALSERIFLSARGKKIIVMTDDYRGEILYEVPDAAGYEGVIPHEPRPIRPSPRETIIPSRVVQSQPTGRLVLADIYTGRSMQGVERGEIKQLLVMEQLPKPINFSGGPWPITAGGSFTLARVLGTVDVAPDGSADFEVPAGRPLFLVALDARGRSVKRMRSFLNVQGGEVLGCVGCHEQRISTPLNASTFAKAFARQPDRIDPFEGINDVPDFPRDIQPILDRHCVSCHNTERREGGVSLVGDHTAIFCVSFWNIMKHGLIVDGRNSTDANTTTKTFGSGSSRLLDLLDGAHHDAKLSERERLTVQLWIDASSVYAGTYAALGSGMSVPKFPLDVFQRRCAECHAPAEPIAKPIGGLPYYRFGTKGPYLPLATSYIDLASVRGQMGYYKFGNGRPPHSLCNITRPADSLMLRAPLSRKEDGYESCGRAIFESTADPDYRLILAAIEGAMEKHDLERRFDMSGFRPNDYYIHQMKRYGVLPADLKPTDPVDPYQTDRIYWDMSYKGSR